MPTDYSLPINRSRVTQNFGPFSMNSLTGHDATNRGEAFHPILSGSRVLDTTSTANCRPFKNTANADLGQRNLFCVATHLTVIPDDVLPGSANRETQLNTTSFANGGGIYAISIGTEVEVYFGIRRLTSALTTGSTNTPTYGDFRWARSAHTGANNGIVIPAAQINTSPIGVESLVLPFGCVPGDILQCVVAFRQLDADPILTGYLNAYGMYWRPLTTVAPP